MRFWWFAVVGRPAMLGAGSWKAFGGQGSESEFILERRYPAFSMRGGRKLVARLGRSESDLCRDDRSCEAVARCEANVGLSRSMDNSRRAVDE